MGYKIDKPYKVSAHYFTKNEDHEATFMNTNELKAGDILLARKLQFKDLSWTQQLATNVFGKLVTSDTTLTHAPISWGQLPTKTFYNTVHAAIATGNENNILEVAGQGKKPATAHGLFLVYRFNKSGLTTDGDLLSVLSVLQNQKKFEPNEILPQLEKVGELIPKYIFDEANTAMQNPGKYGLLNGIKTVFSKLPDTIDPNEMKTDINQDNMICSEFVSQIINIAYRRAIIEAFELPADKYDQRVRLLPDATDRVLPGRLHYIMQILQKSSWDLKGFITDLPHN
ncbi:hypothetical protein [Pseudoalteromonas denitrificans]|uniref:Uncharacterized protein n=1 Tax=Pseudoalteromonas denitrificans DSM 6059 TaxID=1123010 RepID=A0A1I1L4X4_9GAMM|nr:hypothetical protein [Pseudoalteromonas denitrificans]SFC66048.1 hypothetical protein SAMN02745724_02222 [Pseudoalteromonas denitrificans DSM 6059]